MITIDKDAAATPSTEVEVSPDQQAQQQGLPSDDVSITSQDRVSLAGDQVYSPDFLDRNFSGRETLGAEVERQRVYRTFSAIDEVRRIATENGLAPHELKLSGEETLPSALRLQLERAIETKIEEGRALIAERQGIDIDQVKYSLPPRVAAELLGRMKLHRLAGSSMLAVNSEFGGNGLQEEARALVDFAIDTMRAERYTADNSYGVDELIEESKLSPAELRDPDNSRIRTAIVDTLARRMSSVERALGKQDHNLDLELNITVMDRLERDFGVTGIVGGRTVRRNMLRGQYYQVLAASLLDVTLERRERVNQESKPESNPSEQAPSTLLSKMRSMFVSAKNWCISKLRDLRNGVLRFLGLRYKLPQLDSVDQLDAEQSLSSHGVNAQINGVTARGAFLASARQDKRGGEADQTGVAQRQIKRINGNTLALQHGSQRTLLTCYTRKVAVAGTPFSVPHPRKPGKRINIRTRAHKHHDTQATRLKVGKGHQVLIFRDGKLLKELSSGSRERFSAKKGDLVLMVNPEMAGILGNQMQDVVQRGYHESLQKLQKELERRLLNTARKDESTAVAFALYRAGE